MKVLVIGSEGFIGSSLTRWFSEQQHEVWGADVAAAGRSGYSYFQVSDSVVQFEKIFKAHRFDICLNCGGSASVPFSLENPYTDYRLNVGLVATLLENIRLHNPSCKFLQLSSAAVYGNPQRLPVDESQGTMPISPYGIHKLQAEQLCEYYTKFYSIPTVIVRIFSAYGAGLRKQLFWDVFQKVKQGNPLAFFGTGKETRDFINIEDVVQAIDLITNKASFQAEIYNLASGRQTTIEEAITTFLQVWGGKEKPLFNGGGREGDPLFWEADISRIEQLGFKPHISLEQGLKTYLAWAEGLK